MKIISIDPAGNGATAILVADVDGKDIQLTNFALQDYRFPDEKNGERIRHNRALLIEELIDFVKEEQPDLVIIENFIHYRAQMGAYGQTFPTAEMIGVIDYMMRLYDIPIVRVRASDLRLPSPGVYEYENKKTGEIQRVPKPRKFKPGLTTKDLKEDGYLVARRYNRIHLIVNGTEYCLADYKIGAKNDHIIMALRHLVNYVDKHNVDADIHKLNVAKQERRPKAKNGEGKKVEMHLCQHCGKGMTYFDKCVLCNDYVKPDEPIEKEDKRRMLKPLEDIDENQEI